MDRQPLKSRALVAAGYDPILKQLELEFRTGRVYRYDSVPPGVYDWLMRSESKGGYVSRMIDGKYEYEEVTPNAEAQDLALALTRSLEQLTDPDA